MPSGPSCHACSSIHLSPVAGMAAFAPISSDIRLVEGRLSLAVCEACGILQKVVDACWTESVEGIYREYAINHQSGGSDPVIFTSLYGAGPRAEILVRHLLHLSEIPAEGRLLDIGCANGNILRTFARLRPQWALYGMEKSPAWAPEVLSIPGVEGVFTSLEQVSDLKFDFIIMSHVLEHIPDPARYLRQLSRYLCEDGTLFIAVPDIRQNPIDLFVLDHCTHFDEFTLSNLLTRGGFCPVSLSSEILGKEIVAFANPGSASPSPTPAFAMPLEAVAAKYVNLCTEVRDHARRLRAQHSNFGVMGTSTAAAWIAHELQLQVDFFVDEDLNRIGHTAFGKPIHSLADVPSGGCVFIPMSNVTAQAIMARCPRNDLQFSYLPWNQIDDVVARVHSPSE